MERSLWDQILQVIYPRRCLFCDEILSFHHNGNFCEECKEKGRFLSGPLCSKCGKPLEKNRVDICYDCSKANHIFTKGRALWLYQDKVRDTLKRYKFEGRSRIHIPLAEEAYHLFQKDISWQIDLITSVPLHPNKLSKRGYNQSALIARHLGKLLEVRWDNSLLFRVKNTAAQKDLADSERILNVKNAFRFNEKSDIQGLNVLIIDDIYTTGATLDACAKTLIEGGAAEVYTIVIAIGKGY